MAGHSKWANIQHRKNAQDAKRGKLFTKFIREITVAAKMGGADLNTNPRLRLAVDKALSANMTKDVIQRATKRGAGGGEDENLEEIRYEGYAPGGVAVLVDAMTDNRNRTVGEIRHAFSKSGGQLGTDGSVAYLFTKRGQLLLANTFDEAVVMDVALEAGADDVITHDDGSYEVLVAPQDFETAKALFIERGLTPEHAEVTFLPAIFVEVDKEDGEAIVALIDKLEDLDDVQNVYTNADIPDEVYI